MGDKYQEEVAPSLHPIGFNIRTDPQAKRKLKNGKTVWGNAELKKEPGRPDKLCVRGGRSVFIENKYAETSYAFNQWHENQREWYAKYCKPDLYGHDLWFWIVVGKDAPNRDPEKYMPRKAWLMPVQHLITVEELVSPIQGSLPYRSGKHMDLLVQQLKLDCVTLFKPFALTWLGKGKWDVPPSHLFFKLYVGVKPLYRQEIVHECQKIALPAVPRVVEGTA